LNGISFSLFFTQIIIIIMATTISSDNNKVLWTTVASASVVAVGIGVVVTYSLMGRQQCDGVKKKKTGDNNEHESWNAHIINNKHHDDINADGDGSGHHLEEVFPGMLYRLESSGCDFGPPVRNMIIYRIPPTGDDDNGGRHYLLIYNGIAVQEKTLQEILALGTPSVLVVPNAMHRCCAGVWKRRFPKLIVICPTQSRVKVDDVVAVDQTLTEFALSNVTWKDWLVDVSQIDGWDNCEDVLEVKLTDQKQAMIVCDSLFTLSYNRDLGMAGRIIQWIFDSHVDEPSAATEATRMIIPKVSRVARIFFIKDWTQAEVWFRNYAKRGPDIYAILVGHGPPVVEVDATKGCADAFEGVADQLTKPRW